MSNERGFTLIEVMVALLVFGLAALALIRLQGAGIRGTATVDAATVAQIVARNVAVAAMTDARPPAAGRVQGTEVNAGRRWRWVREVRPTGDARILRIDVRVADQGGTVRGQLTMVRPPDRGPVQ
jgi:general secretion pathway protein I